MSDNFGSYGQYLTRRGVANALDISVRTVDRLIRKGEFATLNVGRAVRIESASVRSFIDEQLKKLRITAERAFVEKEKAIENEKKLANATATIQTQNTLKAQQSST